MNEQNKNRELKNQGVDYATSILKSIFGAIPYAGPVLGEIVEVLIPNQRIDRIVKFAEVLEKKILRLEQDFITAQLKDENFVDLIEEGLFQASRSLSDERREYIASIVANSLTFDDIEYQESKHLLRILGEINDVEIILLRFYFLIRYNKRTEEFKRKHAEVLKCRYAPMGAPQDIIDKATLQRSYEQHLARLDLLAPQYKIDKSTKQPKYNQFTGAQKFKEYQVTPFGKLLLKQIGLGDDAL